MTELTHRRRRRLLLATAISTSLLAAGWCWDMKLSGLSLSLSVIACGLLALAPYLTED